MKINLSALGSAVAIGGAVGAIYSVIPPLTWMSPYVGPAFLKGMLDAIYHGFILPIGLFGSCCLTLLVGGIAGLLYAFLARRDGLPRLHRQMAAGGGLSGGLAWLAASLVTLVVNVWLGLALVNSDKPEVQNDPAGIGQAIFLLALLTVGLLLLAPVGGAIGGAVSGTLYAEWGRTRQR